VVEANAVAPEEELPKEATGVAEYVTTRAAVVASLRFKDRLGGLGLVDVDMMIDFMNLWLLREGRNKDGKRTLGTLMVSDTILRQERK